MPYKMKFEVEAEARGLKRGVLAMLEARFGEVPPELHQRLAAVTSAEHLESLVRQAAVAPTLDEFVRALGES